MSSAKMFQVVFPCEIIAPTGLVEAVRGVAALLGPNDNSVFLRGFTIKPVMPQDPPDGFDCLLIGLAYFVCKKWEAANPTMVMWPAQIGFRPIDIHSDGAGCDMETFQVVCFHREDYHGNNPANPNREVLQAAAKVERAIAEQRANGTPGERTH